MLKEFQPKTKCLGGKRQKTKKQKKNETTQESMTWVICLWDKHCSYRFGMVQVRRKDAQLSFVHSIDIRD